MKYPNICGFPGGLDSKESACSVGDSGSIPGLGRSPGEGNAYTLTLQYSCLENSMNRGYHPRGHKELDTTDPAIKKLTQVFLNIAGQCQPPVAHIDPADLSITASVTHALLP